MERYKLIEAGGREWKVAYTIGSWRKAKDLFGITFQLKDMVMSGNSQDMTVDELTDMLIVGLVTNQTKAEVEEFLDTVDMNDKGLEAFFGLLMESNPEAKKRTVTKK